MEKDIRERHHARQTRSELATAEGYQPALQPAGLQTLEPFTARLRTAARRTTSNIGCDFAVNSLQFISDVNDPLVTSSAVRDASDGAAPRLRSTPSTFCNRAPAIG